MDWTEAMKVMDEGGQVRREVWDPFVHLKQYDGEYLCVLLVGYDGQRVELECRGVTYTDMKAEDWVQVQAREGGGRWCPQCGQQLPAGLKPSDCSCPDAVMLRDSEKKRLVPPRWPAGRYHFPNGWGVPYDEVRERWRSRRQEKAPKPRWQFDGCTMPDGSPMQCPENLASGIRTADGGP